MSLQVPLPLTHANQVTQWSSFEVYTWITKHNDKFGLSQDDLDSIEESPLTGKQLMNKDDEQLSQEWAISIHAARKIVKKASSVQKKAEKRKSEPIISIFNNGNTSPKNKQVIFENKTNDKASLHNPSLDNIPEDDMYSDTQKQAQRNGIQSPNMMSYNNYNMTPKQSYIQSPHWFTNEHKQFQQSLIQTKLTLSIKNDTFMARLSHPKWWMDGHFNYIPNKIGCKDSISIEITGDLDTPLVGLMSFTLTLDPRYASSSINNGQMNGKGNGYAFNPYVGSNGQTMIPPHIPSWMIGPGGLPYIPPSVTTLYQLQQEYIKKLNELQKTKVEKKQLIERKKRRKEERRRMKEQAKQHRLAIKREKKKIKQEEKRKKKELKLKEKENKNKNENENDNNNKENNDINTVTVANIDSPEERENKEDDDDDGSGSVVEKDSDSSDSGDSLDSSDALSDDSLESDYSVESDIEEDDELLCEEPPKYRLIILWSITPKKTDSKGNVRNDRRDDVTRNSMAMMSVASSDLLHQMNRFNVLLLEDDTDPDGNDEFNLDNSYFNELEQAALIADIEQCVVDNEHFEIAATFGTSLLDNSYTLQIDIDDSLGDWPGPLAQFGSNNPFALGFIPTNIPMTPFMNPYQQQHTGYTPYTQYQNIGQSGYPDITIIPNNKSPASASALLPPKSGGRRSRSNSQPAPPVGSGMDNNMNRLSKTFTLSDVLATSRRSKVPISGIPESNTTGGMNMNAGGYSPISPLPAQGGFNIPQYIRPRMRKNSRAHSSKAPRLSLLKQTVSQQKQHFQQHYHEKRNLFVPPQQQQQTQSQNNSQQTHQSPAISPMKLPSNHSNTLPRVEYEIGDCVFVDDSKLGQIKSIGQHPAWGKGTYYGIRLTEKIGNCDGEWKGQRTFSCPSGYGYFVQRNQLTQKLKTTRFDYINENYIDDKKKEFEKLKETKSNEQDQFAAAILSQKQQQQTSDDESPGDSDIPKPGTNVAKIMGQSSSERILSKTKPTGKYTPKFSSNNKDNNLPKKEPKLKKNQSSHTSSTPSHRRQRSNSKPHVQAGWTGGAPRTVVVRSKIPPIKEHTGYLHCIEGAKYQQQMEWKKAIEKFKLGIALLEVSLVEVDRSMTKRKWKAQIEEFRHKMSRCTFEIQNNKRSRFIKKRNAIAKEQAIKREQAALQIQAKKMKDAKAEVVKREDQWKVTREDMDKKIAENEIDPNYDPSTGIRPDSDDEVNSGRIGGDKTLAKAKKQHKKKKKKGKKGKDEDWSKYPGYENSGKNQNNDSDNDDDEDDKKKDSKISKHDKELRNRIEGDVMTADTDVSFSDVVGLNNVKLALYEAIILPHIRPDLFESVKKSTQGLLLFGPPGNGKTMIAKCVASECDATFFSISASSITSKFVGEAERIMRTLFQMARQRAPSIIFIDEIDSLLRARGASNEGEASRKIKTEFLIQFDGVKTAEDKDKTITVIGATNLPDQLDNAVLRRFPKRIMVPNPDATARYSLIRLLMSKHRHNMSEQDFRQLADKTENYSCSDIAMLCNDAAMGPLRSMKGAILLTAKKSDIPKIALVHFEASLKNIRASCDPMTIKHYFGWDEQFGSKLFLTMDVLPDNMKQKPLLTVEKEKQKIIDAENAAKQKIIDAENERKQAQKQKLLTEKKRLQQQKLQKEQQEKRENKLLKINAPPQEKQNVKSSKLLKINAPSEKNAKSSKLLKINAPQEKNAKSSKLLKINAPPQKSSRRKSENLYQSTKRKSKKLKNSASNGSKHIKNSSSGNVDVSDSIVDNKKSKFWNKRSSKSGNDKKKKVKK